MSKQSSIDWLIEQVKKEHPFWTDIFEQAKAMHKEEIKNAWINSLTKGDYHSSEEYYNETFNK